MNFFLLGARTARRTLQTYPYPQWELSRRSPDAGATYCPAYWIRESWWIADIR